MKVLLIQRLIPPFKDKWAIPGGFVNMDETVEQAAERELKEETGLENVILSQFKTYSAVDRDPRGRTISVVFTGIAKKDAVAVAADDAKDAAWYKVNNLPELAFDHQEILNEFLDNLRD